MDLKNYSTTISKLWTGRIDDPDDIDSFRMHQIVRLIDLTRLSSIVIEPSKLNICFIGFNCDEGVARNLGRKGARDGAEYIRRELANLPVTFGNDVIIFDAGDISCVDGNMEEAQVHLKIAVKVILDKNLFPIVLGGGHELAFGHYNGIIDHLAIKAKDALSLGIINFDAHFDLRPYKNGGSSGTMFAQIADSCVEQLRPFSYMCLGIQASSNTISLFKKADALGVRYILGKDFVEPNFESISKSIDDFIYRHDHIYFTLCSDVINASFAPGVSAIQPFGMNAEVVLAFIKQIFKSKRVVSFDVAEVSPRFDQDNRTAKLIAIIIFAIINTLNENKRAK
ncbi:MAG: formimidoylglutamase [Bacteroidales bacterium]|nr:MAG: formimidoylglutamase [Bacteroidales bacterium]